MAEKEAVGKLLAEMAAAGDATLQSTNGATLETLDQMISFEKAALSSLTATGGAGGGAAAGAGVAAAAAAGGSLHSFLCPINKSKMRDPVMAADGHSYERQAIQRWFDEGGVLSPMTGAALANTQLTPNHNLRQAIDAHEAPAKSSRRPARPAAAVAKSSRRAESRGTPAQRARRGSMAAQGGVSKRKAPPLAPRPPAAIRRSARLSSAGSS